MPFLLFSIHCAYGLGTIVGLIRGFKWKKEYKGTVIYLENKPNNLKYDTITI